MRSEIMSKEQKIMITCDPKYTMRIVRMLERQKMVWRPEDDEPISYNVRFDPPLKI